MTQHLVQLVGVSYQLLSIVVTEFEMHLHNNGHADVAVKKGNESLQPKKAMSAYLMFEEAR